MKPALFEFFIMIDYDGINVGWRGDCSTTWLEFDSEEDALAVIQAWNKFIKED